MQKRGSIELVIVLIVLVVAVIGMLFVLKTPRASGRAVQVVELPVSTGGFAIPAVKEYGGAIRGVAVPGTRAFPAGRAFELPEQSCYTCDCLTGGITAASSTAAERVCADNCGGRIVGVAAGECR